MKHFLAVVVLVSLLGGAFATLGVDVSSPVSESAFHCLKSNGYNFAVARAWESVGRADPSAPGTLAAAHAAGISNVDVYIFPCPKCGNGAGQVEHMVDYLRQHNVKYGMIWFDIEGSQYWMGQQANRQFFNSMLEGAKNRGQHVGIYTSASQWGPIMGAWNGGSGHPLWYAHYDGSPNFGDFRPFGGWSKPSIKQFAGTTSICGVGVDKNWYP